ncbi:hypothetical protein ABTE82_19220, partial [Acinetobacter baumannii]
MPKILRLLMISLLVFAALYDPGVGAASEEKPGVQNKALVVLVFDQTCKNWCEQVRPVVQELKDQYEDRVTFAELDATESLKEE